MKVIIMFKDPDGVHDSIQDAVKINVPEGLDLEEREILLDHRVETLTKDLSKWIDGDYVYLEFDTETKEIKVLESK